MSIILLKLRFNISSHILDRGMEVGRAIKLITYFSWQIFSFTWGRVNQCLYDIVKFRLWEILIKTKETRHFLIQKRGSLESVSTLTCVSRWILNLVLGDVVPQRIVGLWVCVQNCPTHHKLCTFSSVSKRLEALGAPAKLMPPLPHVQYTHNRNTASYRPGMYKKLTTSLLCIVMNTTMARESMKKKGGTQEDVITKLTFLIISVGGVFTNIKVLFKFLRCKNWVEDAEFSFSWNFHRNKY